MRLTPHGSICAYSPGTPNSRNPSRKPRPATWGGGSTTPGIKTVSPFSGDPDTQWRGRGGVMEAGEGASCVADVSAGARRGSASDSFVTASDSFAHVSGSAAGVGEQGSKEEERAGEERARERQAQAMRAALKENKEKDVKFADKLNELGRLWERALMPADEQQVYMCQYICTHPITHAHTLTHTQAQTQHLPTHPPTHAALPRRARSAHALAEAGAGGCCARGGLGAGIASQRCC